MNTYSISQFLAGQLSSSPFKAGYKPLVCSKSATKACTVRHSSDLKANCLTNNWLRIVQGRSILVHYSKVTNSSSVLWWHTKKTSEHGFEYDDVILASKTELLSSVLMISGCVPVEFIAQNYVYGRQTASVSHKHQLYETDTWFLTSEMQ